ncbi:MAG: DUF427 domain-containing protein [Propionibacteriaceae bacterium]|nr:DUF427 domain-containing protein [Propionibacteriaceae bacterium]
MPLHPVPDPVAAGVESVWDYPRPPALRRCRLPIELVLGGEVICGTAESWQVLETSHPPTYYLPRSAFREGVLVPGAGSSVCEWKGAARYVDLVAGGRRAQRAGWYYPNPSPGFEAIAGHLAVYAGLMDACYVAGELVTPQPGGFYGGWITSAVAGPFKGVPGSAGW